MARVNVYLPDDLAEDVRRSGINLSAVTQAAIRRELAGHRTNDWLASLRDLPRAEVAHESVLAALDDVRADAGDEWPGGGDR